VRPSYGRPGLLPDLVGDLLRDVAMQLGQLLYLPR